MSKILILGGTGYTGRLIARHLLEQSEAEVTVAARNVDKAQTFVRELNQQYSGQCAGAVYADTANLESLRAAFRGQNLVVIAAPTTVYAETVIYAALETGVDYLDVQLCAKKFAILQSTAGEIKRAGRCFITEAGFHPGLPAALVRYAAANLDTIQNAITAEYFNTGRDLPYTEAVNELIESLRISQAQVYKNNQWTKGGTFQLRSIDFGSDIGLKQCYSMFLEELRPLPEIYPSLKEVGFYLSESHWMTDRVIIPITWMLLKIMPHFIRPIGKFLWWGLSTFHKPPYRVELQIHAAGLKDGNVSNFRTSVAYPDGYGLTAIPVVATLLQYLDGSARKPGLWMMGYFVEPIRLLRDMEKMGCIIRQG
ncbi:saccharopine dehydrogenase NADP-binding domain-containing protein [Candidatus Contubernalis alkaliaceticus]|uniref:saccharopine dehydrogenase NADP-binding domain-containing protein n=1 Tax=Candidatus Contubernalis alkaliaceticus TaxID=338645 RepID=UPI001F4BE613|nr:saccharopine dehydrogenase NADP-binding domain-containing protein [Candidatus Contubernalis alkalaceticus]UNC92637.1 saccharopine dehydrogenase NADP-binding domain-containing protein [Candidatus Contubernalis alkalaceticus]